MLYDIMNANAEQAKEHKEKLEAQQQFNELAAKYDELMCKLKAGNKVPEPLLAESHHSQGARVQHRLIIYIDTPSTRENCGTCDLHLKPSG